MAKPGGIFYTPVTGIWQTVRLEPMPDSYISKLKITPDIDLNQLTVDVSSEGKSDFEAFEVVVSDGGKEAAKAVSLSGNPVQVNMPENVKLWDTETPFLYDLTVTGIKNGKPVDKVESYAAMRKISMGRMNDGVNASA